MLFKKSCLTAVLVAGFAANVYADQATEIPAQSVKGSGCNKNSILIELSQDLGAMKISYDDFLVTSDHEETKIDCAIAVLVESRPGFRLSIENTDYKGAYFSPRGTSSISFISNVYTEKGQETVQTKRFNTQSNGVAEDFSFETNNTPVWNQCGNETLINIETTAKVPSSVSKFSLETVEVSLEWKTC